MRVLTYTSYKDCFSLYTPVSGSIAIKSCRVVVGGTDAIKLQDEVMIIYVAALPSGNKGQPLKINISKGTYTIDDFNAKMKIPIQLQHQNTWKIPEIKQGVQGYYLSIPKGYTFIASSLLFTALGIEPTESSITYGTSKMTLQSGSHKTLLTERPKKIYIECGDIDPLYNEINEQPSRVLVIMLVDGTNTAMYTTNSPIFTPLDLHLHSHLHFTLRDENQRVLVPTEFHIEVYNKEDEHL